MWLILTETLAPLLSLAIFVLGTGFLSTLLAIILTKYQVDTALIGSMMSVYYAGLMIGCFHIERLIVRIGHIRSYAIFSAIMAIVCLLHGLFYSVALWMVLRFIAGIASAGLYIVIESWLLGKSVQANRGQIFALYMIAYNGMYSLGQLFINVASPHNMTLFALASILCSFSILPIAMTIVPSPQLEQPSTLKLKALIQKSASGLLGSFSSGMLMAVIFGLLPVFLSRFFQDNSAVARYMFAIILGGMLFQYPFGKASDIIERRLVLIFVCLGTIFLSFALMLVNPEHKTLFFILIALLGGLIFSIYPISVTQTCDNLDAKDIVAGTQTLLVSYSVGSMIGPIIAAFFMQTFRPYGIIIYFMTICALSIPMFIIRKIQKAAVPQEESFAPIPQSTPVLMEQLSPDESSNQS